MRAALLKVLYSNAVERFFPCSPDRGHCTFFNESAVIRNNVFVHKQPAWMAKDEARAVYNGILYG